MMPPPDVPRCGFDGRGCLQGLFNVVIDVVIATQRHMGVVLDAWADPEGARGHAHTQAHDPRGGIRDGHGPGPSMGWVGLGRVGSKTMWHLTQSVSIDDIPVH